MDGSGLLIRATVLSGSTCVAVFGPGYAAGILHFVGGEVRLRAIGISMPVEPPRPARAYHCFIEDSNTFIL